MSKAIAYKAQGRDICGDTHSRSYHHTLEGARRRSVSLDRAYGKRGLQIAVEVRYLGDDKKYHLIEG